MVSIILNCFSCLSHSEQTLFKKFQGVFKSNPGIEWSDALVGYLRSFGYFVLRPYLEKVSHIRILVGINVDAIMAKNTAQLHTPFALVNLVIAKRSLLAGACA